MTSKRSRLGGGFYLPAILTVVTVIYLIDAFRLGPPMRDGNMTAAFFPMATAIVMLIALGCAMFHALRTPRPEASTTDDDIDEVDDVATEATAPATTPPTAIADRRYLGLSPGAIGVIVLTAAYLVAFDAIGYFVSTAVYVLLLCLLFGGNPKEKWPSRLIATAAITLVGYLLFEVVFQVRLPTFWSQ